MRSKMIEKKRKELFQMYQRWEAEFKEICPQLRNENYSYPYYLHIPDGWYNQKYRVMVVGEEGAGSKQFDVPIIEAQEFNEEYLLRQLDKENTQNIDYEWNKSPFWRRLRAIQNFGVAVCWNNIDKIHAIRKGRCNIKKCDRLALHSVPTKILAEEIRILNPTHIVYFGWYGLSLQEELPEVFNRLYPNGLKDNSQWIEEKYKEIVVNDVYHIFTYHPGWGQRQKGYEKRVMDSIKQTMK